MTSSDMYDEIGSKRNVARASASGAYLPPWRIDLLPVALVISKDTDHRDARERTLSPCKHWLPRIDVASDYHQIWSTECQIWLCTTKHTLRRHRRITPDFTVQIGDGE